MASSPFVTKTPYSRSHRYDQRPSRRLLTVPKQGRIYDVAPDVIGVKTAIANLFMIGAPGSDDWVLVDAGMQGYGPTIRQIAEQRFGPNIPPKAIVLTHAHFDHVGSIHALLSIWDVPVYVHRLEKPFVTGQASYPPPDPTVGGGFMAWSSFFYPKHPIDLGDRIRVIADDGLIPELPGWRVIETPGHSPGHISLFRDEDRVLIAGDATVTIQAESFLANVTLTPVVQRPPAYFTPDWPAARVSIQKLAELNPSVLATGHGKPLYGEAMLRALQLLAYEFERHPHGLPTGGRYRDIPAFFNEATGTTKLPPVPWARYALGVGVLLMIGAAVTAVAGRERE